MGLFNPVAMIMSLAKTEGVGSFTDLFKIDEGQFGRGLWSIIGNMDMVIMIVSGAVSVFAVITMAQVIMRRSVTYMYLSDKSWWDTVDEVKQQGFQNQGGGIVEKIIAFVQYMLPNFKALSDYSGKQNINISEDDDIMKYTLAIAGQTLIILFLCTISVNGTLMSGIAQVVEAADVATAGVSDLKLVDKVEFFMNSGADYDFVDRTGSDIDEEFRYDAEKRIYRAIRTDLTLQSEAYKAELGLAVESYVQGLIGDNALRTNLPGDKLVIADADADAGEYVWTFTPLTETTASKFNIIKDGIVQPGYESKIVDIDSDGFISRKEFESQVSMEYVITDQTFVNYATTMGDQLLGQISMDTYNYHNMPVASNCIIYIEFTPGNKK